MTAKKARVMRAKEFRKATGLPIPEAAKASKIRGFQELCEFLESHGLQTRFVETVVCPEDEFQEGELVLLKAGREVGRLQWTCTGWAA